MRLYFRIYCSKLKKAYKAAWQGWTMQDGLVMTFPLSERLAVFLILPFFGLWWAFEARRQYYDKFIEKL